MFEEKMNEFGWKGKSIINSEIEKVIILLA